MPDHTHFPVLPGPHLTFRTFPKTKEGGNKKKLNLICTVHILTRACSKLSVASSLKKASPSSSPFLPEVNNCKEMQFSITITIFKQLSSMA